MGVRALLWISYGWAIHLSKVFLLMARPIAGLALPAIVGRVPAWFGTDADCLDYLEWLRWPDGFVCPRCEQPAGGGSPMAGTDVRRVRCPDVGRRRGRSSTGRRTPLTVWFMACWMFATQKDGMSALSLQRALEIGSYQTAWAMLHRLRSVLVRPGRDRLTGTVEVDETYIGGEEPGLRGGRPRARRPWSAWPSRSTSPAGIGRARMAILTDASAASLHPFLTDNVEPGATVITDGWQGYRGIDGLGYSHDRAANGPLAPAAKTPASCCPACTGSPRWPSGGCWAPTRARSTRRTCRATSTSSSSASTAAAHAAAAWSSTASSSSPSPRPGALPRPDPQPAARTPPPAAPGTRGQPPQP